jgi:hypothetical protein
MPCKFCESDNQARFGAEVCFVFTGRASLENSPVYTIQKPVVCLDCGFTELAIANRELQSLRDGIQSAKLGRLFNPARCA